MSAAIEDRDKICSAYYQTIEQLDIILDEPTASLDAKSGADILQTIAELKQEGKYILLITHKESTMRIADKIVTL